MTAELEVWRCPRCPTVLAKVLLVPGSVVEIRCKRCGMFCRLEKAEERVVTHR